VTPAGLELGNDFRVVERHDLDPTSWIEVVPGFVREPDALFAELRDSLDWQQRQRLVYNRLHEETRLVADYPDLATAPAESLRSLARRITDHYAVPYDGVWVNLYRDQSDRAGWHGDWPTCRRGHCTVPVLSLGAERRFLIRPRDGGASTRFVPAAGDLLVMRGRCQTDWRHAVPSQRTPAGPRISINFSSSWQGIPEGDPESR
jgi:alkylated DNA repair dioxygenase AlkB